jgi:hypothetical protein
VNAFVAGSKISALAWGALDASSPPSMRTRPSARRVAVGNMRGAVIGPTLFHVRATGS